MIIETESKAYQACRFELNGQQIAYRLAKTTPTKNGMFVTLWKRLGRGPILPFDLADSLDIVVIEVRTATHSGQFIFPITVLHKHGYISQDGVGGKRAMRVYPPWVIPESKQAAKTQAWQCHYFHNTITVCVPR